MLAEFTLGSSLAVEVVAVPLLLLATIGLGRLLKRRFQVPLGLMFQLFCATFALWLPFEIFHSEATGRGPLLNLSRAATILFGAFFVVALVRRFYWELWFERTQQSKAPKFLSQLTGLALFLIAVCVVLGGVYHQSIQAAVFGSTVVVGIIGFAMQDLLGNIIAGIALELGKPFRTGDWLIVDQVRAEVIEVNWRSTKLRTPDDVFLDIPNKTIVGTTITNLTYPTRQHASRMTMGFEYETAPNVVKDVVARAAAEVKGVLANPGPKVFLKEFGDSAVLYELKFWIDDETSFLNISDTIRTNIWYAAQRHGIRIPFPIRTVQLERLASRKPEAAPLDRQAIRKQPFLQLLDDAQLDRVLAHARLMRFGRGEKVLEQGAPGESMFVLKSGQAEVFVASNGHLTQVATLGPGDYLGEMSLLTGEPRSATVRAKSDCEMWEIAKPIVADLLQENAALVQKLGELLAKRRLDTEGILASRLESAQIDTRQQEYTASFLRKLSSFFEL